MRPVELERWITADPEWEGEWEGLLKLVVGRLPGAGGSGRGNVKDGGNGGGGIVKVGGCDGGSVKYEKFGGDDISSFDESKGLSPDSVDEATFEGKSLVEGPTKNMSRSGFSGRSQKSASSSSSSRGGTKLTYELQTGSSESSGSCLDPNSSVASGSLWSVHCRSNSSVCKME